MNIEKEQRLRIRYGDLIDKKFSVGLGDGEEKELQKISDFLDAVDALYYEPTIEKLKALGKRLAIGKLEESE